MPKVSVIIPVYNVEKYLKRALDSVSNQTLKDIEIICVDDKSSDNSIKILEEYAQNCTNIKIVRFSRNKGVAKARNEGIRIATGEYIAFLDPDDYVDTDFYEALYNVTITKDLDIVKGGKKTIDMSGDIKDSTLNQFASQNKYNFTYEFCTALYKTSFIKNNHFDFPENIINGEDCVFLLKCILNTDKIEIINEVYYYYCRRKGSLNARSLSLNSILSSINSVKERLLYINNSKLYDYDKNSYIYAFNQHLSMHIGNYYQCKSIVAKYLFCKSIITFYYLCKATNMLSENINRKDLLTFIEKGNVLGLKLYLDKELAKGIKQTSISDSECIPIVLASDENQYKQMYVTILSALSNKKKKSFYDFYLLVPENFKKEYMLIFEALSKKFNNCKINFIKIGPEFVGLKMSIPHITLPTYYRLKIAKFLPDNYKKAIYFDTDVIILKDLTEYFNIDLTDSYIAGVKAAAYLINTNNRNYYNSIGLYDLSEYINAGVTLWNLQKIRQDNMTPVLLDLVKNNYQSQDQDVINLAFYGNIKCLSAKYNLMTKYEEGFINQSTKYSDSLKQVYSSDNFKDIVANPVIIHYADGNNKPWNNYNAWLSEYWWKYAEKSGLFKKNIKNKQNLLQKLFSVKNEGIRKVIAVFGIKIKFKSKKLIERKRIEALEDKLNICSNTQRAQENIISEQSKQIKTLHSEIDKQNIAMTGMCNELSEKTADITNLHSIIDGQSSTITGLRDEIDKQFSTISGLHNEIDKHLSTITCLQEKIDEQASTITDLQDKIVKDENQIIQMKRTIDCNEQKFLNSLIRITPQVSLRSIVYHLADNCNLRCWGCDHFAPLAEENYVDINIFESDIKRLSELLNQRLQIIKLMGGEPLLNKQINEFMCIARKHFPHTRIEIVTNGILLSTKKGDFWNCCREQNITIVITKYPLEINYDKIQDIANSYNVGVELYGNTGEAIKTSYHIPLDVEGKQNPIENFLNCFHANNCVMLKQGKIYPCTVAPNIEHFNKYFGYNIPLGPNDGLDIYKANSEKEILDYLSRPMEFCKYCAVKNRTFGHPWSQSNKNISEWSLLEDISLTDGQTLVAVSSSKK